MKRILTVSLIMWSSVFVLPSAVILGGRAALSAELSPSSTAAVTTAAPTAATEPPQEEERVSTVSLLLGGEKEEVELERLVASVVAAEMPALWPMEALKAQAVAVRSYILWRQASPPASHPDCAVCSSPAHCFAVADLDTLASDWGENGQSYLDRVLSAVDETAGEILVYGGEPIMAVFHAMSAFRTDSCSDIWGGSGIAYLTSVPTPLGEQSQSGFETEAAVDAEAFRTAFLKKYPSADLSSSPEEWFTDVEKAASGSVLRLQVGGREITGAVLRQMCGLRSAAFDVRVVRGESTRIVFTVYGYGHGVGMSQYGAKVLASEGRDYAEILCYYYPGTELTNSQ